MSYPELRLRKGTERSLLNGHPWVYSGAVNQPPADADAGCLVDVVDHHGRFIGRGHYNPHSPIRVRILTRDRETDIDSAFLRARIGRALRLRMDSRLTDQTDAFRVVHGESDGLPGLVVDRYADYAVVQFHTAGVDGVREEILDAIDATLTPAGLYERSDVGTRRAEGLSDRPAGPGRGTAPPDFITISEGGAPLVVDVYHGQKTGFFLDQRDNRLLLRRLCHGRELLNAFAYTSGFSLQARRGGAKQTLDVDVARSVLPAARQNLQLNTSADSRSDLVIADAFGFIDDLGRRGPRFDAVVLDPPALLRKRADYKKAMGVYIKLNRNALRLLRDDGLLVTASCSSRITPEDFFAIVQRAAASERVGLRIVAYNLQPPDHPVNPAFPEGRYLKCVFAKVIR